jgi:short-subunit dehydrogenase
MTLGGRVAVITGASSGIGLACAEQLAAAGCAVVLGARRGDRLADAVRTLRSRGSRADSLITDVTSEKDVEALVAHAIHAFGGLDILICNAGFGFYGSVEETPAAAMHRIMDVNFHGTFHAVRAALPHFRTQARGHVVIMTSIVGQRGIPQMSAYSATKAAQVGFAESLRSEFSGTNIHISVVYPVSTDTEFREAMKRDYGHAVAGLGPRQSVDHVARAVVACVKRPKPEVYPHRMSRALAVLNAVVPAFTDTLVRKYGRRRSSA